MRERKRYGSVFLGAALVVALQACGGDSMTNVCPAGTTGTPPNCVAIPSPCTQSTVLNESGPLDPRTLVYDDFSVPDSGRLDVTMDWTFASSPVGFYLVPVNTCTLDEFNARRCTFLIRSEPSTVKPRKVSQPNFSAGNYRWIVANFADVEESATLLIVLSKGTGCPALASPSRGASAHASEDLPELQRAVRR